MESEDESTGEPQDFCSPFQGSDQPLQNKSEDAASLEGEQENLATSELVTPRTFHTTVETFRTRPH